LGVIDTTDRDAGGKHDGRRQDRTRQWAASDLIDTCDERQPAIPVRLLELEELLQTAVLCPTTAACRLRYALATSRPSGSRSCHGSEGSEKSAARLLLDARCLAAERAEVVQLRATDPAAA